MFHPIPDNAIMNSRACKGAFVLKYKQLSSYFLVFLMAISIISSSKLVAQDDIPVSDEEIILPTGGTNTDTPPVIIDEGDSEGVSDVEEYDG